MKESYKEYPKLFFGSHEMRNATLNNITDEDGEVITEKQDYGDVRTFIERKQEGTLHDKGRNELYQQDT